MNEVTEGGREEDPTPPPMLGMGGGADEVYAKVGAANDLVVVRKPDGTLTVSDFHVSEWVGKANMQTSKQAGSSAVVVATVSYRTVSYRILLYVILRMSYRMYVSCV